MPVKFPCYLYLISFPIAGAWKENSLYSFHNPYQNSWSSLVCLYPIIFIFLEYRGLLVYDSLEYKSKKLCHFCPTLFFYPIRYVENDRVWYRHNSSQLFIFWFRDSKVGITLFLPRGFLNINITEVRLVTTTTTITTTITIIIGN